ncbi:hypothetical protein L0Z72_08640, partial [candidate division KSB1 bacterium]|nr:hypothetical protein [candidate division KSB1 bacterium]
AANTADKIVGENLDKLHGLAAALLEREILDGPEIDAILENIDKERSKNGKGKGKKKSKSKIDLA